MTEREYQELKAKVERELPARKAYASICGVKLTDQTLAELVALALVLAPDTARMAGGYVITALRTTHPKADR